MPKRYFFPPNEVLWPAWDSHLRSGLTYYEIIDRVEHWMRFEDDPEMAEWVWDSFTRWREVGGA